MPLIPQVSCRLDGGGFRRWASAPCCGSKQALEQLATAWGGGPEFEIGQTIKNLLYNLIFALLWAASGALTGGSRICRKWAANIHDGSTPGGKTITRCIAPCPALLLIWKAYPATCHKSELWLSIADNSPPPIPASRAHRIYLIIKTK